MTEAQSAAEHVKRALAAKSPIKAHGMTCALIDGGSTVDLVAFVAALTRKERLTLAALLKTFG